MYRACELKDQTYKKTRTLHFSDTKLRLNLRTRCAPLDQAVQGCCRVGRGREAACPSALSLANGIVVHVACNIQVLLFRGAPSTVRNFMTKKKQHKHKLFGPDFPRTFLTLPPCRPWVKKFLPITGAAEKRTFWCGRPRFLARTSMTRRVFEKLCTKKVCVAFFGPYIIVTGAHWTG